MRWSLNPFGDRSSISFVPMPCLTPSPRHELRRTQVTPARLSTFVARRAHALRRAGRVCSIHFLCVLITAVACRVKRTRGPIWDNDFFSKASVLMLQPVATMTGRSASGLRSSCSTRFRLAVIDRMFLLSNRSLCRVSLITD